MVSNLSQLFLLADHIKLCLLERQRAISLKLEPTTQDAEISRSLDSFRDGIETLEARQGTLLDTTPLRNQYDDLRSQFDGSGSSPSSKQTRPNNISPSADFSHAQSVPPRNASSSSFHKRSNDAGNPAKSVRFSETNCTVDQANRNALFPYKDEPDGAPDHAMLDNQQIHAYHSQVLQDQDAQLDRLGESIGRQRELTIQIGDELDDQAEILDDVDRHVNRHQTQLDRAKKRVGKVARKAKDNVSLTIILILIVILVLLIIILK